MPECSDTALEGGSFESPFFSCGYRGVRGLDPRGQGRCGQSSAGAGRRLLDTVLHK